MKTDDFQELLQQKGRELYRPMPWRDDTRPYYVLVSELMLQQTQVDRVIPKFTAFVKQFPDEQALAKVGLDEVLMAWSGLGYNRRAKFLHQAARMIVHDRGGIFPQTREGLLALPGVGANTAGAIMAYAFNQPTVFIETNVRTVYLHHFFPGGDRVDDKAIAALVEKTVDKQHPREFYWALMDYGSWLKKQGMGRLAQSTHYKKQSPLKGSVREVRGQIIRVLGVSDLSLDELRAAVAADERFVVALAGLQKDGLVRQANNRVYLTK